MIQLGRDILLFKTPSGQMIPCSAEAVAIELVGDEVSALDPEVVSAAVSVVLHYYKYDLRREAVTLQEFIKTLQIVLRGLGLECQTSPANPSIHPVIEFDLSEFIEAAGQPLELALYPRLRKGLKNRLDRTPELLRVRGLRRLVKHLSGTQRWNGRCRYLRDQIISYLRQCLRAEAGASSCPMVVD
jgi:hypothetical protein